MKKQITQVPIFKCGWSIHVCFFLLSLSLVNKTVAQSGPFNCDTTAYLFLGNPTKMYRLNLNSGVSQLVADPIISSPPNQGINAFGFNPVDNHVWGYRNNTDQIVRIASDYSVTMFSIAGLPIGGYNSGTISESGIMYLYAGNDLDDVFYRIDLNPPYPQLILPSLSTTPTLISDWAISPVDDNLYTIASITFEVYRFDTLGNRTFVGNATGGGVNIGDNLGGIFMDDLGNMYGYKNTSGGIYKIEEPHNGNTTAIMLSQGPLSAIPVDGASNYTLYNGPPISITNDTLICPNASIQLNASTASANIVWQTNPTLGCSDCNDPIASPANTTTYYVTATTDIGCMSYDSVTVSLYTSSLLDLSNDALICEGESVFLNANPEIQVNWTPANDLACNTCTTTSAAPTQTTTYVATAEVGNCLLSDSVTITVDTGTPIILLNDTIICANHVLQLNAVTDANTVNWFPADYLSCDNCFDPVCIPSTDITYLVTTQNVACPDSALITIYTLPLPIVDAGNDTTIFEGQDLDLNASGALNYLWNVDASLSDFNISNPNAEPTETTNYFVTGTDENGCTAIDSMMVRIKLRCNSIFVPNTFTPDDDGLNDVFLPSISGIEILYYELKIWDRWGTLIFESLSPTKPWIGDVREGANFAQDGTYAWQLLLQGECDQGTPQDFAGHVNLIR